MNQENRKANHLINEKSPYLLQHAYNPVNWYPWCEEAFEKAKTEDKPIFLSIGYSTCHWCHVMAHESFEDEETAKILNEQYIAIKVDKEERPDIDSIYMTVCQEFTGSGGWPTSIFMTTEQKPFFAGTYFPKEQGRGMISFCELLAVISEKWNNDRDKLLESADAILEALKQNTKVYGKIDPDLYKEAVELYRSKYDRKYGGFEDAPKFPAAHNLIFLLNYYEKSGEEDLLKMTEHTLMQMYRGGLFDHIGYGFSRYSTDRYFLVPHFEKMLYDNALLLDAYCTAYRATKKNIYKEIAEKTADYILREMTSPEGGFYSAQDADSEGEEGKYYVFTPDEIIHVLGRETGEAFNAFYDITEQGNFEGKNIPNLLKSDVNNKELEQYHKEVYAYRKNRYHLHLDDKILTSWNGLMIAALCKLYRISREETYLKAAMRAEQFLSDKLCVEDYLYVSYREGKRGSKGFLEDYANYIYAQLTLYEVTLQDIYLDRAMQFCEKTIENFWDEENHGFYLYGADHENLIMRPKETYDGAMPSGNSMMAYNLVRITLLKEDRRLEDILIKQLEFESAEARQYPAGYAMFLIALLDYMDPPEKIVVVTNGKCTNNERKNLVFEVPDHSLVKVVSEGKEGYAMVNDRTTYYVCKNHSCMAPTNQLV